MTLIVVSTPVTHVRGKCALRTVQVTGTLGFILGRLGWFRVIGTVDSLQAAVNTALGMTLIIVRAPMT